MIRRLKDLEELYETTRRALSAKIGEDGKMILDTTVRTISGQAQLQCHTPHFLGPSDEEAPLANPSDLSAYIGAGHFGSIKDSKST